MIITKTPYRISLFGGGTDHPAWYHENSGAVVSFAIDKYCYLTTRILPPFFDHNYRIAYSKIETTMKIEEIQHPAVRAALLKYSPSLKLEIHHDGDLPARSGIGSSSAFAVGIIKSLTMLQKINLSNLELASAAISLEQTDLGENVGSQDQIACALGGLNFISFGKGKDWVHEPIQISDLRKREIESRTVLIYTGIQRSSSDVQASLLINLSDKRNALHRTAELAQECKEVLTSESDLNLLGEMLVESWELKKSMNAAAVTPALEEMWEKARNSGALGGKVLGAGGGGFCMFWVKEGMRDDFLKRFGLGTFVPIRISEEGSTCVHQMI